MKSIKVLIVLGLTILASCSQDKMPDDADMETKSSGAVSGSILTTEDTPVQLVIPVSDSTISPVDPD